MDIQPDRIAAYLGAQMPEAQDISISRLTRMSYGYSREGWAFDAEWCTRGRKVRKSLFIRRERPASLLDTKSEPEFLALKALQSTSIPVPRVLWLETSGTWLETPFFVMEKAKGVTDVDAFLKNRALREKVAEQFVRILANLHTADWRDLGPSFLKAPECGTGAASQEIAKWENVISRDKLECHPMLTEALIWLKNHKPSTEVISLVHGDYRAGNFLHENGVITAFLDWELIHLGDPMEDLGWICHDSMKDDDIISSLMTKRELFQEYTKVSGIKVDEDAVHFYQILCCVKLAAIGLTAVKIFSEGRTRYFPYCLRGFYFPSRIHDCAKLIGY